MTWGIVFYSEKVTLMPLLQEQESSTKGSSSCSAGHLLWLEHLPITSLIFQESQGPLTLTPPTTLKIPSRPPPPTTTTLTCRQKKVHVAGWRLQWLTVLLLTVFYLFCRWGCPVWNGHLKGFKDRSDPIISTALVSYRKNAF